MQDGFQISLQAWDFPSLFTEHHSQALAKAAVIVLVLDGTVQNSHTYLNELGFVIEDRPGRGVSKLNKDTRFVIAVNKSDLPQVLTRENIEDLAVKLNCLDRVHYISALEGGETFQAFVDTCVNLGIEYADYRNFG
jgi:signal recognition particle receptor subunit beta